MENFNELIINCILKQASFESKPKAFEAVNTTVLEAMEGLILEFIETLPKFTNDELCIKSPLDFFKETNEPFFFMPQLFVLEFENDRYLINTDGFKYCRYVLSI
jgi:hypothetical protein